MKGCKTK